MSPARVRSTVLLRSYLFTGAEGAGGHVRLVGAALEPSDEDDDFSSSVDRVDENPLEERVHFWSWFAAVAPRTSHPTWTVESWTAAPPPSPAAPGGEAWHLVQEGTLETRELVFAIVTSAEMGSSDRVVSVRSRLTAMRVHLVDAGPARAREDAWFDRQEAAVGGALRDFPPENPGPDVNPVLVQVWPV